MVDAIVIIIVIGVAIGIIISVSNAKKMKENVAQTTQSIAENDFVVSKKLIAPNNTCSLMVDDENKKWCFVNGVNGSSAIFDFKDLLEFEVFEDGTSIAQGRAGSAIIGGMLFGGIGAIAGAARSREIKTTCNILQIRAKIKSLEIPEVIMHFISTPTKKDSVVYRASISEAKQFAATLTYIENDKQVDIDALLSENIQPTNNISTADEISKYKKLMDDGVISEEEFNEKKKQLLNL